MMAEKTLYCSFCGCSQFETPKLVVAPGHVGICAGCVALCVEIVTESFRPHREMLWGDIGIDPKHALGWYR